MKYSRIAVTLTFDVKNSKMEDFKLIGIDHILVDRIYFHTEDEKLRYLASVENMLKTLAIEYGDDRLDIIDKIAAANVEVEFFRDVLAYTGDLQYSKNYDRNNYYTNCRLCEHNLEAKVRAGVSDFKFEELLFASLMAMDIYGYAKANLIFVMGRAFLRINQLENSNKYFNFFRSSNFDLSPLTIADFYKSIADLYLKAGDKEKSLFWLREGLIINPKLSVKKMIKILEAE